MKRELRVFCFYLVVLSLFRIVFILGMRDYMGADTGAADVAAALWRGLRLSCQSAAA